MFVAWVLFPLVLLAVCLGCGLAVERVGGWALPGTLLPAVGLALVIVASTLTTSVGSIAPSTTWVVVLLALAGYASSWRRLRALRPEGWAVAVGLALFAVYAAPQVASGNATFLGYLVLNDLSYHFGFVDQVLAHGHNLVGLAPSSLTLVLHEYFSTSYPTGADVALGAVRPLVGQDVAWVFQPYLAVIMTLGGLVLYELLRGVVRSRPLRAACAFIAAQSGLVYAYYLQASVKELATTMIISLTVVLVVETLRQRPRVRVVVPLIVTVVAGLDVLSVTIIPWLGIALAVFVVIVAWRARHTARRMARRRLVIMVAAGAAVLAALAAPIIGQASTFFNVASAVLTANSDLGNLVSPLTKWQILGIWPTGDFRMPVVSHYRVVYALLGVAIASAVLGAVWIIRRRSLGPLLLLGTTGIATAYLLSRGSPYASAKVMMIFSLTVVLIEMLGAAALFDAGRRIEAWVLAVVIGGGVLWTNALAYHGASVAPRDRLVELQTIGKRFQGRGPTWFNVSDEYPIHFLRTEAPSVPIWQAPTPRPGLVRTPDQRYSVWDTDDVALPYLERFRLLLIARSPVASRPPANFQLAYRGRYYDVWQRTSTPQVLAHVPLGSDAYPTAVPSCRVVMATAAQARRAHAELAYYASVPPVLATPSNSLALTATADVPRAGRYQVWLGGEISERLNVLVDGRRVGSVAYEVERPGQFVRVGQLALEPGEVSVQIVRAGTNLEPGSGHIDYLWPVALVPETTPPAVGQITPERARSLCGRQLDWIEIVRP